MLRSCPRIHIALPITAVFALSLFSSQALAASKPAAIKATDLTAVAFTIKIKGKAVNKSGSCYKGAGGTAKRAKKANTFTFTAFSTTLSKLKKSHGKKDQIALYTSMVSSSKAACKLVSGPIPDFLSLQPYTGKFTEVEAHTLFDRFAFGASPERIQQAVKEGLKATVVKLTTKVPEPNLDAIENNMRCNGLLPGDPRNGTQNYKCDATDPNDIDMGGLKSAILYRMWYSQNPFFENQFFFLHNRFQSVNTRVLEGCQQWAVVPYINLLRRAAASGDYTQYLRDFASDYFAGIIWLHLLDSTKDKPNEDEAREILQLGGMGALNLAGAPNYTDLDIAQNALALSGWVDTSYQDNNDNRICVPAFSQQLHAPGPETLFRGTPYEARVSDLNTVVQAIMNHPATSERIASNIFDEYINPYATPVAVRALAALIRTNKYNLLPVMKTVMMSQALFAPKSRKSLPKQPLELMIGFLKTTGMPLTGDYNQLTNLMDNIGQVPLQPGTVFGWTNRDGLAGESYVLERRNAFIGLLNQNIDDLSDKHFTYWDRFLSGIPADSSASAALIARLQSWFNVQLNAQQVAAMDQFLNYDQQTCNQYTHCAAGQTKYLSRHQLDASADSTDEGRYSDTNKNTYSNKTRGAIAMMTMMPDYMLK